jgi:hypothetical protein
MQRIKNYNIEDLMKNDDKNKFLLTDNIIKKNDYNYFHKDYFEPISFQLDAMPLYNNDYKIKLNKLKNLFFYNNKLFNYTVTMYLYNTNDFTNIVKNNDILILTNDEINNYYDSFEINLYNDNIYFDKDILENINSDNFYFSLKFNISFNFLEKGISSTHNEKQYLYFIFDSSCLNEINNTNGSCQYYQYKDPINYEFFNNNLFHSGFNNLQTPSYFCIIYDVIKNKNYFIFDIIGWDETYFYCMDKKINYKNLTINWYKNLGIEYTKNEDMPLYVDFNIQPIKLIDDAVSILNDNELERKTINVHIFNLCYKNLNNTRINILKTFLNKISNIDTIFNFYSDYSNAEINKNYTYEDIFNNNKIKNNYSGKYSNIKTNIYNNYSFDNLINYINDNYINIFNKKDHYIHNLIFIFDNELNNQLQNINENKLFALLKTYINGYNNLCIKNIDNNSYDFINQSYTNTYNDFIMYKLNIFNSTLINNETINLNTVPISEDYLKTNDNKFMFFSDGIIKNIDLNIIQDVNNNTIYENNYEFYNEIPHNTKYNKKLTKNYYLSRNKFFEITYDWIENEIYFYRYSDIDGYIELFKLNKSNNELDLWETINNSKLATYSGLSNLKSLISNYYMNKDDQHLLDLFKRVIIFGPYIVLYNNINNCYYFDFKNKYYAQDLNVINNLNNYIIPYKKNIEKNKIENDNDYKKYFKYLNSELYVNINLKETYFIKNNKVQFYLDNKCKLFDFMTNNKFMKYLKYFKTSL